MSRIIIIIAILLSADLLAAGSLWYGFTTMQEKKADEAKQRAEVIAEGAKGAKLAALAQSIALAQNDRKILAKYLFDPSEENQIKFISQMEGLSAVTGASVTISSLNMSGNKVHAEFVLRGKWAQIYHTLRLVEELPTRAEVNRFSVTRSAVNTADTKANPDDWNGSIALDILSLQPVK